MGNDISMELLRNVLSKGSNIRINGVDQFNRALFHIFKLLEDSSILFKNKSYSTSVFLSISAIEEVAKLHIGLLSRKDTESRDPLKDHKIKHGLGSLVSIKMGKRLQEAIGHESMEKIFNDAHNKQLVKLRESSLYFDSVNDIFSSPRELISPRLARDLLLYAIESFDDGLVGYTNYSIEISLKTDIIFKEIAHIEY